MYKSNNSIFQASCLSAYESLEKEARGIKISIYINLAITAIIWFIFFSLLDGADFDRDTEDTLRTLFYITTAVDVVGMSVSAYLKNQKCNDKRQKLSNLSNGRVEISDEGVEGVYAPNPDGSSAGIPFFATWEQIRGTAYQQYPIPSLTIHTGNGSFTIPYIQNARKASQLIDEAVDRASNTGVTQ